MVTSTINSSINHTIFHCYQRPAHLSSAWPVSQSVNPVRRSEPPLKVSQRVKGLEQHCQGVGVAKQGVKTVEGQEVQPTAET